MSPRKVGVVAALVRGRTVADALTILEHVPRRSAMPVLKTVKSAQANADLQRTRAKTLAELADSLAPYFRDRLDYDPEATVKYRAQTELPGHLERLVESYRAVEPFAVEPLEAELRALAGELGVKAGHLIHPLRMALTGTQAGPPVFDVVAAMGREATGRHLGRFVEHLRAEGGEGQP